MLRRAAALSASFSLHSACLCIDGIEEHCSNKLASLFAPHGVLPVLTSRQPSTICRPVPDLIRVLRHKSNAAKWIAP